MHWRLFNVPNDLCSVSKASCDHSEESPYEYCGLDDGFGSILQGMRVRLETGLASDDRP